MAEKSKPKKEKDAGKPASKQEGEKIVVIPLRKNARRSPKNYRMKRSVKQIREFLAKQAKASPSNVFISQQLNEMLWKGGIHGVPAKIKVKVSESDGKLYARLIDEKEKPKKESKRKLGLRQRLTRRKEAAKQEKPEPPKEEKAEPAKEAKPEPVKEKPKEEPKLDEEMLLEESA